MYANAQKTPLWGVDNPLLLSADVLPPLAIGGLQTLNNVHL